jgi:hypothetical protein
MKRKKKKQVKIIFQIPRVRNKIGEFAYFIFIIHKDYSTKAGISHIINRI